MSCTISCQPDLAGGHRKVHNVHDKEGRPEKTGVTIRGKERVSEKDCDQASINELWEMK